LSSDFLALVTPIVSITIGVGTLGGFMYKIAEWINKKAEVKAETLKKTTEEQAAKVKEEAAKTADALRIATEDVANKIKLESDKNALSLKVVTAEIANNVKIEAEKTASSLKAVTEYVAANIKIESDKNAANLKEVTADIANDIRDEAQKTAAALKISTDEKERILREYTDKTLSALTLKIDTIDTKVMTMLQDLADRSDLVNGNVRNIRNDIIQVQEDIADLYTANDARDDVEQDRGGGRDALSSRKNRRVLELERRRKRREIEEDSKQQDHPLYGSGHDSSSTRSRERRYTRGGT
jgi:hypothetical protein